MMMVGALVALGVLVLGAGSVRAVTLGAVAVAVAFALVALAVVAVAVAGVVMAVAVALLALGAVAVAVDGLAPLYAASVALAVTRDLARASAVVTVAELPPTVVALAAPVTCLPLATQASGLSPDAACAALAAGAGAPPRHVLAPLPAHVSAGCRTGVRMARRQPVPATGSCCGPDRCADQHDEQPH